MNLACSWRQVQGIARRCWGRLASAARHRTAGKSSREQVAKWLAREHKRDPIHK